MALEVQERLQVKDVEQGKKGKGAKKPAKGRKPAPAKARRPRTGLEAIMALREKASMSRPKFMRQEAWRYKRIKDSWRRPKGIDSKMRMRVKGWPRLVKVGYRGPKVVRGLHPSGLKDVLVHNIEDLNKLNPKVDAARLASTLGGRKRAGLITRAKELGVRVLNPRLKKVKEGG